MSRSASAGMPLPTTRFITTGSTVASSASDIAACDRQSERCCSCNASFQDELINGQLSFILTAPELRGSILEGEKPAATNGRYCSRCCRHALDRHEVAGLVRAVAEGLIAGCPTAAQRNRRLVGRYLKRPARRVNDGSRPLDNQRAIISNPDRNTLHRPVPSAVALLRGFDED